MTRILVPPGIGDLYWVLTKLPSFMRRENIINPELTVVCTPDDRWKGHTRSIPYLKRFSWLQVGNPSSIPNDPDLYDSYVEAYSYCGRTIWPNFQGYDYFIAYNGYLNGGSSLEAADPDLECNWYPEMTYSAEEDKYRLLCEKKYGKFVALYFPMFGTFEYHLKEFRISKLITSLRLFLEDSKLRPVFVGSKIDLEVNKWLSSTISAFPDAVNLVGELTLDQTLGCIKAADFVLGYHSGLTNLAVMFKKKTLLLWNSTLPASIAMNCFPPDTRGTTYKPLFCRELSVGKFFKHMLDWYNKDIK
jgi:hypothetical protein